jgi:hypothetical protein
MTTTELYILDYGCKYEGGSSYGIFDYDTGRKKAFELAESILTSLKKCDEQMKEDGYDSNFGDCNIEIIEDSDDQLLLNVGTSYVALTKTTINNSDEVDRLINSNYL